MIYAGIDYSMNSPSITVWDSSKPLLFENCVVYNYGNYPRNKLLSGTHSNIVITAQPTYSCNEERFANITRWAKAVILSCKVSRVSIEDYAYGGSGVVFEIGELTGLLKNMLFNAKVSFHVVGIQAVKIECTGKGNAKKGDMYKSFTEKEGVFIEGLLGYDVMDDKRVIKKLESAPWELKPVDDIIDSYYVLKSHPDLKV